MVRPKPKSHATSANVRSRSLSLILRFLIGVGVLGIFLAWSPIGSIFPTTNYFLSAASLDKKVGSITESYSPNYESSPSTTDISDTNENYQVEDDDVNFDTTEASSFTSNSNTLSGSFADDEDNEEERIAAEEHRRREAERKAAGEASPFTTTAPWPLDGPYFACPDGRVGLHVVHMPLLLDQTLQKGASGVFISGQMMLFRDFALPSLASQTSQQFVLYISYDPDQDDGFSRAAQDAVKTYLKSGAAHAFIPDNPRYFVNKPDKMLAFPRITNLLAEHQVVRRKDIKDIDLYISSKMGSDTAVHVDTVRTIQEEACARVGQDDSDRLLATRSKTKLAWFPHANTTYGIFATPMGLEDTDMERQETIQHLLKAKPHMQSLAIDASLLTCRAPLNCYSVGEGDPSIMLSLASADDCPFEFNAEKNIYDVELEVGALIARPPKIGSAAAVPAGVHFTIEGVDLEGFVAVPFNFSTFKSCGIHPGELSAINLLLASVYAEAPYVAGLSAADAQGWGAVGGLVNPPPPPPPVSPSGEEEEGVEASAMTTPADESDAVDYAAATTKEEEVEGDDQVLEEREDAFDTRVEEDQQQQEEEEALQDEEKEEESNNNNNADDEAGKSLFDGQGVDDEEDYGDDGDYNTTD